MKIGTPVGYTGDMAVKDRRVPGSWAVSAMPRGDDQHDPRFGTDMFETAGLLNDCFNGSTADLFPLPRFQCGIILARINYGADVPESMRDLPKALLVLDSRTMRMGWVYTAEVAVP